MIIVKRKPEPFFVIGRGLFLSPPGHDGYIKPTQVIKFKDPELDPPLKPKGRGIEGPSLTKANRERLRELGRVKGSGLKYINAHK